MRHVLALVLATTLLSAPAAAAEKRLYVASDDHTDYVWTRGEAGYQEYFPRALDAYLAQIDATAGGPPELISRFNVDGSFWMQTYERNRSAAEFARLMGRVRDGSIGMPLNSLVSVHGGTPAEGVIREMLYAGRLERRFNLRIPLAQAMENHGWSVGLASIFAGSGATYSWKGLCESDDFNCSGAQAPQDRPYGIFNWRGIDGQQILTKWQKTQPPIAPAQDGSQGPGGYAEARYLRDAIRFYVDGERPSDFYGNYPYPDVVGLFGAGWDDPEWIIPLTDSRSFPTVARDFTRPDRRVIVSNIVDYFRDFSATYSVPGLPVQAVSYGNEWEVNVAAFAAKTGRVKRAIEGLRNAEAVATTVALFDPAFLAGRERAREDAFTSMGLFFEHNVGGGGEVSAAERFQFQESRAQLVEAYTNALDRDGRVALGRLIATPAGARRLFAFNALGWTRTDVAEAALPGTDVVHLVDAGNGNAVRHELIGTGAERRIRWIASSVPSVGYRVYEVRPGPSPTNFSAAATFSAGVLSSAEYRVTLDAQGEITSLIDRRRSNREMIKLDTAPGVSFGANSFNRRDGAGTVALERAGPVSASVLATIGGAYPRTVRVTLYRGIDRVEIENTVDRNFNDTLTYSFPFALDAPFARHGEVGAVLRARVEPAGDYTSRPTSALFQWLTLNGFVHMANGAGTNGMTLSALDSSFFRLGDSRIRTLDTATPRIEVLAGGAGANALYAEDGGVFSTSSLLNQGGDSAFRWSYALTPTAAYSQAGSQRSALEHQNRLVTGAVTGTAARLTTSWSLLKVSGQNLFVWAVKPAEDGIGEGAVVRVWNQGTTAVTFSPTVGAGAGLRGGSAAIRVTHVETPVVGGTRTVPPQQMATFRLPR